jgi:hypothetical protein
VTRPCLPRARSHQSVAPINIAALLEYADPTPLLLPVPDANGASEGGHAASAGLKRRGDAVRCVAEVLESTKRLFDLMVSSTRRLAHIEVVENRLFAVLTDDRHLLFWLLPPRDNPSFRVDAQTAEAKTAASSGEAPCGRTSLTGDAAAPSSATAAGPAPGPAPTPGSSIGAGSAATAPIDQVLDEFLSFFKSDYDAQTARGAQGAVPPREGASAPIFTIVFRTARDDVHTPVERVGPCIKIRSRMSSSRLETLGACASRAEQRRGARSTGGQL